MDKVLDKVLRFLEKHVQWIAVGIGGLIFLWSIWAYWLNPASMKVDVANRSVGPGQVDQAVLDGPGQNLRSAIDDPRVPQAVGVELAGQFDAGLGMTGYVPGQLATTAFPVLPLASLGVPLSGDIVTGRPEQLAQAPAAEIRRLASGRSYVQMVGENGGLRDVAEVRVDYAIPVDRVAAAFRAIALPESAQNTAVLRVELERQRRMPDGSWGETERVALLPNNPLPPLPAAEAPVDAKQRYLQAALAQASWVLQPEFFQLQAGDDPMNLQMVVEVGQPATQPAAGSQGDDQGTGSGDGANGGSGAGTPDGFGNTGANAGGNTGGTVTFGSQGGQNRGGSGRPNTPDLPGRTQPGQQPPAGQRPPQQPPAGTPAGNQPPAEGDDAPAESAIPEGEFNPAQGVGALEGYAWDTQAVPGETYRYRVVYHLKNPVFNNPAAVSREKPELAQVLALESQPGEWSPPITVEPMVYYFLTQTANPQIGTFSVFRWQEGRWHNETFKIVPGDPVGYENNGVKFQTGQTLVDIRTLEGQRQPFALLVDEQGRFSRRTVEDANDPRLTDLREQVAQAAAAAR